MYISIVSHCTAQNIAERIPPHIANSIRTAMTSYLESGNGDPKQDVVEPLPVHPNAVRSPVRQSEKSDFWENHNGQAPPRPTPVKCSKDSVTLVWDAAPRSPSAQIPMYRMEYQEERGLPDEPALPVEVSSLIP